MRALALLFCLLWLTPAPADAQARANSTRHQQLPHNAQRQTQSWPQNQARTHLFCDQYARAAAGQSGRIQGSATGTALGQGTGYIATRDEKQAEALGMVGGAIGANQGGKQAQKFIKFYYDDCRAGGRLVTLPK